LGRGCAIPTISTLTVDVVTNTRSLSRGLKLASTAILGVGVVATKMALDYNDAFTKIAAISNASAKDIAKWKDEVLALAGETAKSPKELADALFFLASAGLKAKQIMPALEASAKGAAVGLGETADVANIVASTLNAYSKSGLKAKQVTDVLVAAVREGRAEPQEFATALGRILPIASAAGISFSDVAASLAGLSNIGLDVNEGVTAMRGLFQALISPTDSAATAMKSVGLSAQDLLDSLQQDGLIATVRMLDSAVKKNTGSQSEYMGVLRDIVPNVRSLTGLLGLTTQEAEKVNSVFQRVRDSTGSLGDAMKTTAESPGFQLRQALTELGVVMIKLGDIIIPALVAVVGFIQDNWEPAWEELRETVSNAWNAVKPFADAIGSVLLPLFQTMWHTIQDRILPVLDRIKPLLIVIGAAIVVFATVVLAQFALVVTAVGFLVDKFLDFVGFVRDKVVEPVVNFLARIVSFVMDKLRPIWDTVRDAAVAAFRAILGPIQAVIDKVETLIGWIKTAIDWLKELFAEGGAAANVGATTGRPGVGNAVPGGFQHGGVVARSGLALVHRGEVFSGVNNEMGFGGINGDINLVVDGKVLAKVTRDQLVKLGNRNAGTGL
jgi:TP901 family phage tail tape measure protein